MSRSGERRVRTRDAPPLIPVDVVDMQVVVKLHLCAIEILTAEQEQVVRVAGRRHDGGVCARFRRALTNLLRDFEEELLLPLVLLHDGVDIGIRVGILIHLGRLDLGFLLALANLLGLLLCLSRRQATVSRTEGGVELPTCLAFLEASFSALPPAFFPALAILM
jgi:hypothetical protein